MNRRERTEILAHSSTEQLQRMVDEIKKYHEVKIVEAPNGGLVMVKMRENAKKNVFYLGEVFVTECKVTINGVMGFGVIKGSDATKSKCMAIIDAAYNAKAEVVPHLDQMVKTAKYIVKEEREREALSVLRTKVSFETLDEEVKA